MFMHIRKYHQKSKDKRNKKRVKRKNTSFVKRRNLSESKSPFCLSFSNLP